MANTVDKVLKIAESEVGYLEKSASAYKKNPKILDEKTNGAGLDNYTKYGRDMHKVYPSVMDFPAAWCDAFVDWCFYTAYGITTAKSLLDGNFDDYTVASAQMYKNKNAIYTSPKVGDQVFFTKNGQVSGCYHTGLVYKVDNTYFYTVEGNTSVSKKDNAKVVANGGGVARKQYSISGYKGRTIFGRPKYDVKKNTTATVTKTTTTTTNTTTTKYSQTQFIKDVCSILGVSTAKKAFDKTITISKGKNKNHKLVTPLERYMKALGYYVGAIEADSKKTPDFGGGMESAIKKYQEKVVKAEPKNQDGIITAKAATWKKLLGLS